MATRNPEYGYRYAGEYTAVINRGEKWEERLWNVSYNGDAQGTIVLVVLCCLEKPKYGYSLVEDLEKKGIRSEANTLYPLLRRLSSQGLLENTLGHGTAKPRKYYVITGAGKRVGGSEAAVEQYVGYHAEYYRIGELIIGNENNKPIC